MSSSTVHEEGFSKDADKLVRRLSLVALLLSRRGQPVSVTQIRGSVEGYPLMTDEAFKRRFYEDRTELAGLGIQIASAADSQAGAGEMYSLPASAYYLPPVELSAEELTALATCLAVLEDRFAYSQPLRLALLSLAQGRPELLTEAEIPPLTVVPETAAPATVLPKLQAAIAERKTVRFAYYAIGRDQELERTVDPYGLQLVAGEWYLVGWCHLRRAQRTFRLSRIRSRVTHATRAPHDFDTPKDFDIGAYRDRPSWQLAKPAGTARIRVAPEMAWWVEAHWGHCGTIERQEGGGIVYSTPYADPRPLLGWLLGLADAAELVEPAELREELAAQLRRLDGLLDADPPQAPPLPAAGRATAAGGRRRRRPPADWRVEVDRFTRLATLTTYLLRSCAGEEALFDIATIRADLGRVRGRAARRRPPAQPRQLRRRWHAPLRRVRGPHETARLVRARRPCFRAPGAPVSAASRHPAPRHRARRRPAAHGSGRRAGQRRRQAARRARGHDADARERRSAPARRRRARRRQRGHRRAPPAGHRLLDRRYRARQPAHRRAVSPRAQPRRVVLRLLVPHRRRQARVPGGHHEAGETSRRALRAATRRGTGAVPARGHPRLGELRAQDRHRLVQPGGAPLDRRAPAGATAGGRLVPRRAALCGRAAGSRITCCASPTRHARWRHRRRSPICAPPSGGFWPCTHDERRQRGLDRLQDRLVLLCARPSDGDLHGCSGTSPPARRRATCSIGWWSAFSPRSCRSPASSSCSVCGGARGP